MSPEPAIPILGESTDWDGGLRLFGAVHYHVLSGTAPNALDGEWEPFVEALDEHASSLARFVATQGVQTNETQRCVALLPCFLTIAAETGRSLELLELGPSAGLNLLVDRYGYTFQNGTFGPADALLRFAVDERRPVPRTLLEPRGAETQASLDIRRRRGIDLSPVDVTTTEGSTPAPCLPLAGACRSHRPARGCDRDASAVSQSDPSWCRGTTSSSCPGSSPSGRRTASRWCIRPPRPRISRREQRVTLRSELDRAAADGRPLAWVSTRAPDEEEHDDGYPAGYEVELRIWPEPATLAATMDFHGNWLDWLL